MAEEKSSTENLDLNLDTDPELGPDPARMVELSELFTPSANAATLPVGPDPARSIAGARTVSEVLEKCENVTEEKKEAVKSVCKDDSFFSISFDLSKNPVLSKCDHLSCWAGLYLWLLYLRAKECPTSKWDVSVTTSLPPLTGRGKHRRDSTKVSDTKTPPRPLARRIRFKTSFWRGVSTPTEMISQSEREFSSTGERRDRPLLNPFMTSRGLREEQNLSTGIDLTSNIFSENEGANGIKRSLAERFMDPTHGFGRNQVQNSTPTVGVAGNDSESRGVINLESEVDTDEIESMLTVPASPSVGIHENGSRVPDVDSECSPPLKSRRVT